METQFVPRIRDLVSRLIFRLNLLLRRCDRMIGVLNSPRCPTQLPFVLSAMKWPVSIAVIVGLCAKQQYARVSCGLLNACYAKPSTDQRIVTEANSNTLSNKENVIIVTEERRGA